MSTECISMPGGGPGEDIDFLDQEIRHIYRCNDYLEALYYTCGAAEVGIEHLLKQYKAQDYGTLVTQLRNMKTVLDNHMKVVRLIFVNVNVCRNDMQSFNDVDEPEFKAAVPTLRGILAEFSVELRRLIYKGANKCAAFLYACKLILNFMIEVYCIAIEV